MSSGVPGEVVIYPYKSSPSTSYSNLHSGQMQSQYRLEVRARMTRFFQRVDNNYQPHWCARVCSPGAFILKRGNSILLIGIIFAFFIIFWIIPLITPKMASMII
jgi:hypothetical protein